MKVFHVEFGKIGTGLSGGEKCMVEIIRYFESQKVHNILLTTDNGKELYERLGLKAGEYIKYVLINTFWTEKKFHLFISFIVRLFYFQRIKKNIIPLIDKENDVLMCHSDFFPNTIPCWELSKYFNKKTFYWYHMKAPNIFKGYMGEFTNESGHFAPFIVFFLLCIVAEILNSSSKDLRGVGSLLLLIFILINVIPYETNNHAFNYNLIRSEFRPYKNFINDNIQDESIVTYPFWEEYALINIPIKFSTYQYPISNTGWDSFTPYTGVTFLNDDVSPYLAPSSIQIQFLKSYNVSILREMGIKYIFDFSDIYQSYWDKYVPPDSYDDNINYVKNDPDFISNIISTNPGAVTQVNKNIIEINNVPPLISGDAVINYQKINNTKYIITLNKDDATSTIAFLQNYHPDWKLYTTTSTENFWWDNFLYFLHPLPVISHAYVFSNFGNKWILNDNPTQTRIILYFKPQIYQNIAVVLFFLTLIISLSIVMRVEEALKRFLNFLFR